MDPYSKVGGFAELLRIAACPWEGNLPFNTAVSFVLTIWKNGAARPFKVIVV